MKNAQEQKSGASVPPVRPLGIAQLPPSSRERHASGLLLALSLFLAAPATHAGLLANWPLNEGSGTITADATGNGHTGTLQNGPAWVTGLASNALNFTSDKRVGATAVGDLNLTDALTLSVWIKPTGPGYGPPSYSIFFAKGNPYFSGWGLYYMNTR